MVLNLASQICQQIQRSHLGITVKVKSSETVKYKNRFWGKKQDGNWVKQSHLPSEQDWDAQASFLPGASVQSLFHCSQNYF